VTNAPYELTWSNASPGDYVLTAVATDNFGINVTSAPVNIQVISVNDAPVAVARIAPLFMVSTNETNLKVLSANGSNATVILDGSLSYDIDGDPLEFFWLADSSPDPIALGASVTVSLDVGEHVITLVVSDGNDQSTDSLTVEVITASDAVVELILQVDQANISSSNKIRLVATLKAACASFDRGELGAGSNQLHAFQNKVRAQVAASNPYLAEKWIHLAQQIIDAVTE
jgi:hypothetical protein